MVNNGLHVFQTSKPLEKAVVRVRLERNGDRLRASLTANAGQSWTNFRSQNFELSKVVKIGVAAFSDAAGPLVADFQEFELILKERIRNSLKTFCKSNFAKWFRGPKFLRRLEVSSTELLKQVWQ